MTVQNDPNYGTAIRFGVGTATAGLGAFSVVRGFKLQQKRDAKIKTLYAAYIDYKESIPKDTLKQARRNPRAVLGLPLSKAGEVLKTEQDWLADAKNKQGYQLKKLFPIAELDYGLSQERRLAALRSGQYANVYTRNFGVIDGKYVHAGHGLSDFARDELRFVDTSTSIQRRYSIGDISGNAPVIVSKCDLGFDHIKLRAETAQRTFGQDLAEMRRRVNEPNWLPPVLLSEVTDDPENMRTHSQKVTRELQSRERTVAQELKIIASDKDKLRNLDLKTLPAWKRAFKSPKTLIRGGAVLAAAGTGLMLYEGLNALKQDGAQQGRNYGLGQHTARFVGRTLGSLAAAPFGLIGGLVGGTVFSGVGENIADKLYQAKIPALPRSVTRAG